ncbi:cyclic lactone autoinducer peptide [Porphyromonadaceae bacterium OttesenSCG-928-L07]|nr:cyclic lactone autoinducer peptide [Porphyromonadaceae bacterium OttesenSCG-928-L07]MDL2330950.1 cyclic lactone autoinducer peptide [Odoribacter sp. OttesenSCG-928-A06]
MFKPFFKFVIVVATININNICFYYFNLGLFI